MICSFQFSFRILLPSSRISFCDFGFQLAPSSINLATQSRSEPSTSAAQETAWLFLAASIHSHVKCLASFVTCSFLASIGSFLLVSQSFEYPIEPYLLFTSRVPFHFGTYQ